MHVSPKLCTKCSLWLIIHKNLILDSLLKWKFGPSPRLHPSSMRTQKLVKIYVPCTHSNSEWKFNLPTAPPGYPHLANWKGVPVGGAMMLEWVLKSPPEKVKLRTPISPIHTAWTGFNLYLYSGGSYPQQAPLLWKIATARSFILTDKSLDRLECTAHHPGSRGVADIYVCQNSPVEYTSVES